MARSLALVSLLSTLASAQTLFKVGQTANTTSGQITGKASSLYSEVSEYLGVPFAQPPVGDLRWAPPQPIKDSSKAINATSFGFSCIEIASRNASTNPFAPQNIGQAENEMSEDCLNLNIWTKPQTGEKKKAVLIWLFGGGWIVGSASNKAYNGALLADQHDVVVVNVNYRLGVLGFPGIQIPERNPSLLDHRMAVEWLRDNVEAFGGDSKRMILFGQSAGGVSADFYAYAYPEDPIVHGIIPQSGNGLAGPQGPLDPLANWSEFSQRAGCGPVTNEKDTASLACLRSKPVDHILNSSIPAGFDIAVRRWRMQPDERTGVFLDAPQRVAAGKYAKIPILTGNTNNENAATQSIGSADALAQNCPSKNAASLRRQTGVKAWRYLYSGEFPNNGLGPCCPSAKGAWHGAELGVLFGTTQSKGQGPDTEEEKKLGKILREAWTSFARDPEQGLEKLGWPVYDDTKETVIVLGGPDSAKVEFKAPKDLDPDCAAIGNPRKIPPRR